MASESGSGIKRHETEGLGCSGVDHFPDIDSHAIAHHRHFIHQADVDHAEGVLQQLHHLGYASVANGHNLLERLREEDTAHLGASRRNTSDDLRSIQSLVNRIAGVDTLGREAEKEVFAYLESVFFERGQQQLVGSARISSRFENHQQAGMKIPGDLLGGRHDVTHVGIFSLAQWRRHADVDGVEILDHGKVGSGIEAGGVHQLRDLATGNVLNVGLAIHEAVDARLLQV